jgi:hypothetical protein
LRRTSVDHDEVTTYGLLPCMLGTKIAYAISNSPGIGHWFMLPLYSAGHISSGLVIAFTFIAARRAFARAAYAAERRARGGRRRTSTLDNAADGNDEVALSGGAVNDGGAGTLADAIVAMSVAFPNSGALPLALMDSLCASSKELLGDGCHDLGTGCVVV